MKHIFLSYVKWFLDFKCLKKHFTYFTYKNGVKTLWNYIFKCLYTFFFKISSEINKLRFNFLIWEKNIWERKWKKKDYYSDMLIQSWEKETKIDDFIILIFVAVAFVPLLYWWEMFLLYYTNHFLQHAHLWSTNNLNWMRLNAIKFRNLYLYGECTEIF